MSTDQNNGYGPEIERNFIYGIGNWAHTQTPRLVLLRRYRETLTVRYRGFDKASTRMAAAVRDALLACVDDAIKGETTR